ncbi:hypothetical protein FAJ35_01955 [Streptococcus suis]|uniref:Uncharacterized protein n=1 Tax=Streptococcus suis TaxID=1307 RepID=A0A4T2GVH7_STRSU|nr:hypothetical protein FAJ35_01955 [Streptococcus suis]
MVFFGNGRADKKGVGKNSTGLKRVRLPTPAQLIRSDLECETRTNLPINHCAEMLTRTLRSEDGLSAQPPCLKKLFLIHNLEIQVGNFDFNLKFFFGVEIEEVF